MQSFFAFLISTLFIFIDEKSRSNASEKLSEIFTSSILPFTLIKFIESSQKEFFEFKFKSFILISKNVKQPVKPK